MDEKHKLLGPRLNKRVRYIRISLISTFLVFFIAIFSLATCNHFGFRSLFDNGDRVVIIGDSLSAGWSTSLQSKGYAFRLTEALESRERIVSHQIKTGMPVAAYEEYFQVPDNEDTAVIELGTNDARLGLSILRFTENYEKLVTHLSTNGVTNFACIGIFQPNSRTQKQFDDVIKTACQRVGGKFIPISDIYERRDGRGPIWEHSWKGTADLGHPNDNGHDIIYQRLSSRIGLS